jgi:hypothetical protein
MRKQRGCRSGNPASMPFASVARCGKPLRAFPTIAHPRNDIGGAIGSCCETWRPFKTAFLAAHQCLVGFVKCVWPDADIAAERVVEHRDQGDDHSRKQRQRAAQK